ncbi:uncharacterized protein LOC109791419 [Cajanus cajan]|uniref:uncharacterized protein LOC109791419 n=1 Tax=Cajanus cajan TaxID=3821 RepID=UPI00098DA1A6|nr:uncharacterized protein LOC109791419 [Cajanus cajan]
MKNRASGILKLIAALRSMAKSKALALKSKTNAMKARLVIFSLVMNKKYVMSTISDKFQSLLGHHSHLKEDCLLEDDGKCMVADDNAHLHETHVGVGDSTSTSDIIKIECSSGEQLFTVNPRESHVVPEDKDYDDDDGCECWYGDDDGDGKYPDLTHTMFESEDLDLGGSVIDLVKSSKEEAGEEFKMEDEIDHMADLFIKKFRRQILLQKQDSLKRHHDMLC